MRFAYADPPYLGCCGRYDHQHHGGGCWDDPATHRQLVERLSDEYPDGWALSLHTPSLRPILPMTPEDVRVCAWVKPFAVYRPGVPRAYAWEPVIVRGGRDLTRQDATVRDFVSANITLRRGFVGAKPYDFCAWMFEFLGADPDEDTLADLFTGSGAVTDAWNKWKSQGSLHLTSHAGQTEVGND